MAPDSGRRIRLSLLKSHSPIDNAKETGVKCRLLVEVVGWWLTRLRGDESSDRTEGGIHASSEEEAGQEGWSVKGKEEGSSQEDRCEEGREESACQEEVVRS